MNYMELKLRDQYQSNGYIKLKKFLSNDQVNELKNKINNKEPKLLVPFSQEAWGFGNLLSDNEFKIIYENTKLLNVLREITGFTPEFNHCMANRKPAWIGPEVEYHQEIYNAGTFAPGASRNEIQNKWIQIYIPLEDEKPENGGLRIIEKSHLLEDLPYEDFVNQNFSHKRRVPVQNLNDITRSKGCFVKDLFLNRGDCLIFSPLLIHGSPSNGSSQERISLVLQARPKNFKNDDQIFDQETAIRNNFIIDSMTKIINNLKEKNRYIDFNSEK